MTIGLYVIMTNSLKMDPDSELRHMVVASLTPYWHEFVTYQLQLRGVKQ